MAEGMRLCRNGHLATCLLRNARCACTGRMDWAHISAHRTASMSDPKALRVLMLCPDGWSDAVGAADRLMRCNQRVQTEIVTFGKCQEAPLHAPTFAPASLLAHTQVRFPTSCRGAPPNLNRMRQEDLCRRRCKDREQALQRVSVKQRGQLWTRYVTCCSNRRLVL